MICQLAAFHSPADLQIMVVTSAPARWDWLKWLPHCQHREARGTAAASAGWCSPRPSISKPFAGDELLDRKEWTPAGQRPARRPRPVCAAAVGDHRRQLRRSRGLGGSHRQARRRPGLLRPAGTRGRVRAGLPATFRGVGFDPDTTYRLSDGVLRKRVGVGYR